MHTQDLTFAQYLALLSVADTLIVTSLKLIRVTQAGKLNLHSALKPLTGILQPNKPFKSKYAIKSLLKDAAKGQ
jgi:hypothetical protein